MDDPKKAPESPSGRVVPARAPVPRFTQRQRAIARYGFGIAGLATLAWVILTVPILSPARTSTKLVLTPAAPGEPLVIIAAFDKGEANKGFNASDRMYSLLTENLPPAGTTVRVEKLPEVVGDQVEARKVLNEYSATLLIWGWYDEGGAEANVELNQDKVTSAKTNFLTATPESFQFTNMAAQASYLAFFSLGMMQLNTNPPAATQLFTAAIQSANGPGTEANPWEALMWRGNVYEWSNKQDLAIADFTSAIALHPLKEAYYNRGNAYGGQDQYDLAIADYTKAIEIDPNYAHAYVSRGANYGGQGKYDLAIADYTKAIEIDPNNAAGYYNRGVTYTGQGIYDLAIADYAKAIEINPKDAGAYYNRAIVYDGQGKFDLAIADNTKVIELDPNTEAAYVNRGILYRKQGKYDLAIADFTQAIEMDPQDAVAYFDRAIAYSSQVKLDLAIADYTQAIEIDPNNAGAYTGRGNVNAAAGRLTQAIADYKAVISLRPDAYTYCVLGITYTKTGDFTMAIAALEQGVNLDLTGQYPVCQTALDQAREGTPTP